MSQNIESLHDAVLQESILKHATSAYLSPSYHSARHNVQLGLQRLGALQRRDVTLAPERREVLAGLVWPSTNSSLLSPFVCHPPQN